ncbi:MAG: hypothetical protein ACO3JL_16830, partial [Myxococcota bacterium]
MMTRFGDFSLLRVLGESSAAECYEASHDVEGGPFFLKRYRNAPPRYVSALEQRCEALLTVQHGNLAPHIGHGDVDGVWFTVAPLLVGLDLEAFLESCRKRRVVLRWDAVLFVVREVARGVAALHAAAPSSRGPALLHGEVCARHVRL